MLSTDFDQSIVGFLRTKYDLFFLFLFLFLFLFMRCDLLSLFCRERKDKKKKKTQGWGEMLEIYRFWNFNFIICLIID